MQSRFGAVLSPSLQSIVDKYSNMAADASEGQTLDDYGFSFPRQQLKDALTRLLESPVKHVKAPKTKIKKDLKFRSKEARLLRSLNYSDGHAKTLPRRRVSHSHRVIASLEDIENALQRHAKALLSPSPSLQDKSPFRCDSVRHPRPVVWEDRTCSPPALVQHNRRSSSLPYVTTPAWFVPNKASSSILTLHRDNHATPLSTEQLERHSFSTGGPLPWKDRVSAWLDSQRPGR
ncbi:unnamed protein product [Mesocestoides corti]|nr:unnamed protein product [Mesocestoides corti]